MEPDEIRPTADGRRDRPRRRLDSGGHRAAQRPTGRPATGSRTACSAASPSQALAARPDAVWSLSRRGR